MLNPHPFPFKWIDWTFCNWVLLFICKVPPLCTTADQETETRKESEDPVSEGSLEERQVPEHAAQQSRFKDKVKKVFTKWSLKLITLAELWSQPSFPEFVDWLIRFVEILWSFFNPRVFDRDREGKSPTPSSWSDENAWLPFYSGLTCCFFFFSLAAALALKVWGCFKMFPSPVCPVCDLPYTVLKLDSDK